MASQQSIYDQLKKDHQAVQRIMQDMVESGDGAEKTRQDLVEKLRRELLAHSHAEERLLYQELERHEKSHDIALEGEEEHHAAELLLKELEQTDVRDAHWKAKAKVLQELLRHHIEEEESNIFQKAQAVLDEGEATSMARRFQQEKQQEEKRL